MARRLRQPRYLLGSLVGAVWLGSWFSRVFAHGGVRFDFSAELLGGTAGQVAAAAQLALCAAGALIVLVWWALPFGKHAIELSEAELHLLLPAPLSRRRLIQYAVLRSQPGVLLSAAIVTLLTGARGLAAVAHAFAATWLIVTVWDLHGKGRSLWLARLEHLSVRAAWRRRLALWCVLLGAAALLLAGIGEVAGRALADPALGEARLDARTLGPVLSRHVEAARHGMVGWLLTPLLWLTSPWFLRSGMGFLARAAAWAPALVILVAHHEWVVRSQTRFEEAALASARRRSRAADPAARYWRSSMRRRRLHPFRLAADASPETAVVWKNLSQVHRWPLTWTAAAFAVLALVALVGCAAGLLPAVTATVLLAIAAALLLLPPLLAPRSARCDLRADLLKVEVVRTWPIPSWRLFLAQASSSALVAFLPSLAGGALLLALALADALGILPTDALPEVGIAAIAGSSRLALAVAVVTAALPWSAALALLGSLLENLAALLFPSWVELGLRRTQAAARAGQNLVVFLALSLVMMAALAPAAILVGSWLAIQLWLWRLPLPTWEIPLLAWVALAPVVAVMAALVAFGARAWQRLDPSAETLTASP